MNDPSLTRLLTEASGLTGEIAAVLVCLVVLAFSSLSEAALVRMEIGRARQLAEERGWVERRLLGLVESRQEVLSTLILLINLSVIVVSAYTTEIALRLSGGSHRWVVGASVGMIAFILIFCELTPKMYGVRRAEPVALAIGPVLALVHRLVRPIALLLHLIGLGLIRRLVVPIFGGTALAGLPRYTDQEVLEMMVEGEARGGIEEGEREMIAGVIEFADKVAREVMTPRTDIVWVEQEASLTEAAKVSEQTGYSRLPVCLEDVDHVVGILYMKDVVSALGPGASSVTAGELARKPAPMVPESRQVHEVLRLMQRKRLHMAIVIDEYGGTAGLVTIEDLLEEIFGEIRDEHDVELEPIRPIDERSAVVDARVSVDDIEDHFGVELPEGEFDSIGGFILDQLGHLPAAGEQLSWRNLDFTVEAVSENRIQRIRIVRRPEEVPDEQEGDEAE
jgi:CBS domain containing-hemolysin-like protein